MIHRVTGRLTIFIGLSIRSRPLLAVGLVMWLMLPGCTSRTSLPPVLFHGMAPSRSAVTLSLQRFQTHFKRSIFATLRVHGHRLNVVGRWITKPPPHFDFIALTELGTLAVQLRQVNHHISIVHAAVQFPKSLARTLGYDLYIALAAPAAAARSSPVIVLNRHDAQLPVSGRGHWHGVLYFSGTAGHLRLAQLISKRGRVTIRYSRYQKGFQPERLNILDADHGLAMTLDFTGNIP